MFGKTITIDAPLLAGKGVAGNWLALKAAPSVAAKAATRAGVAKGATLAKAGAAPKVVTAAKGSIIGGSVWTGTGWSLGFGLGLGALGPVILGATAAGLGYSYYRKRNKTKGADAADG